MVYQRFEYSSTVWDPNRNKDIHNLEQVQGRAARLASQNFTERTPECVQHGSEPWLESLQHRLHQQTNYVIQDPATGHKSNSWFVAIREICFKYESMHPLELHQDPPGKELWKHTVIKQVNGDWLNRIRSNALLYPSLHYLNVADYQYG